MNHRDMQCSPFSKSCLTFAKYFFFCCLSVGNNSADFCYGQKGMRPKTRRKYNERSKKARCDVLF